MMNIQLSRIKHSVKPQQTDTVLRVKLNQSAGGRCMAVAEDDVHGAYGKPGLRSTQWSKPREEDQRSHPPTFDPSLPFSL